MKNLLVASILESTHIDGDGNNLPCRRIKLICKKDEDSWGILYAWFTEDGEDCEVSSRTLQGAKRAACLAWGFDDPTWQLRARWIAK